MLVVITGLVVFRAPDMGVVQTMLAQMWVPMLTDVSPLAETVNIELDQAFAALVLLLAVVLLFPNSQQILHRNWVSIDTKPADAEQEAGLMTWRPKIFQSATIGVLFCVALSSIGASSSFLYYQF
ncbi:MAG: hypothetical protein AAFO62_11025 [Pseudomonadota bacterium]